MTPALEFLARRAVACRGWRWMPGMVTVEVLQPAPWSLPVWDEAVVIPGAGDDAQVCTLHGRVRDLHVGALPDLTSPATLGCLLALVREVYGSPSLYCRLSSTTRKSDGIRAWEVIGWLDPERSPNGRGGSFRWWGYASEAEALVAALEAAPLTVP